MPYFPRHIDASIRTKADGSPVTIADGISETIVTAGLRALTPDIPVIAEEQAEEGTAPDIRGEKLFWLVDPLDGTKEFIKANPDFCINIALVKYDTPIFGAVYCPATHEFYYGGTSLNGAFHNDKPMALRDFDIASGLTIVGTENYKTNKKLMSYLGKNTVVDHITRGSTLKFLLIAEGKADFYARFVPTYEWDTAAAHAILLALGGDIIDFETKERLTYRKHGYRNGPLVTGTLDALKHFKLK